MQQQFCFLTTTLLLGLLAVGCDDVNPATDTTEPVDQVTATTATVPARTSLPVEQDQIEFTRNVDPSTIKEITLPAPVEAKPVAPVKPAKIATGSSVHKPAANPEPTAPTQPANTVAAPSHINSAPATAQPEAPTKVPIQTPAAITPPDHAPWNTLLQRYVTDAGNVNYAGLKKNEAELDNYLATLQKSAPTDDWGRNATMAYWINAYNAFTIKRVLEFYPVNSIQDISGGDPWKVKWIDIDGKSYSLNNIEHDILRPRYKDARIHFAVNCAATSCPPLPNRAFTAENLDRMLETSARAFIRNPDYNQTSGSVKVSKIFDWYGEDFGDLRGYLNEYLATAIPADKEIGYKEYDWALNKQ
ncbi:DUF547 domain-containing protein [Neolewinella antarctica]|uniref:DUF547 domain-containing protein n=1 Tax=Neolewinella antarctica TaxID=442734 RepID=A0ABX0X729_9BACT|nr:DUF547 domain-containing protein [Neolewinella antarctica]NJC25044.1 hypothetical protein [Neolewinella antarctica]